jgi:hypothetical protein
MVMVALVVAADQMAAGRKGVAHRQLIYLLHIFMAVRAEVLVEVLA